MNDEFKVDGETYVKDEFSVIYAMKRYFCNRWSYLNYVDGTPIEEAICINGNSDNLFKSLINDLNKTVENHIPIEIYSREYFGR